MTQNYSLNELQDVAKFVIENADNKVILFYGEMGVGKTTLIKEIVKQLGVEENVSSPTFSLVNEYLSNSNESVFHFDFYRIDNEEEAMDIGIDEYFYSNSWCLVEWPNKVENLLPLESVIVTITENNEFNRTLELKNNE